MSIRNYFNERNKRLRKRQRVEFNRSNNAFKEKENILRKSLNSLSKQQFSKKIKKNSLLSY